MVHINGKRKIAVDLLPLIALVFCSFIISLACMSGTLRDDDAVSLTDGWVTADGQEVTLKKLPVGDVVISHDLTGIETHGKALCFKSTHTHIEADFDGNTAYTFAPKQKRILGISYGMYVHTINIPENASKVTLTLHPLYKKTAASLDFTAVESPASFIKFIYHKGLPSIVICLFILFFGILMLMIGIPTAISTGITNINFFSLGVFSLFVGFWSMNDTLILQTYTQNPGVVRYLNYLSLILIAYPPVSFLASATNDRETRTLPVLKISTALNLVLTLLLTSLGVVDIRSMLFFSHINIALAILIVVFLMIRAVVNDSVEKSFMRTLIISLSPTVLGVMADLIRYLFFKDIHFSASLFTKVGMTFFIAMMGLHLMRDRTRLAVERGQTELMRKMAYTDGLTELGNRAAFHEKESQIRRERMECVVVQLDINCLKTVNDVYGHAEGDRHIIGAARIINESFAAIGTSYRTGGDEFVVVTEKGGVPGVEKALAQMEKSAQNYNRTEGPPVPLQIAYGYAECYIGADMLDDAEFLADKRMYQKKRQMKEE